jgi:transposase
MVHAGLDLSRRRLDVSLLAEDGTRLRELAIPPDRDGLRTLARWVAESYGQPVQATIESMTGARFVHDQLEFAGWDVEIADAVKVKGLAPLACKTDRIDAWVLAELSRRDLVPAIWLPDPEVRAERERARWRLHLVKHRTALKNRIHQTLISFGHQCPVSDLFGVRGRQLLEAMDLPEPWQSDVAAALELIDDLERRIDDCERELRWLGADHPYIPLLQTVPGIAWVLGYTIAAEIGDISRFPSANKLCGYTGLCPKVKQSGNRDERGSLAKNGPRYLRWALIEAAHHAGRSPHYRNRYERTRKRLGKQRGPKVAAVEIARQLAEAIWHMLNSNQPFAPAGAANPLVA